MEHRGTGKSLSHSGASSMWETELRIAPSGEAAREEKDRLRVPDSEIIARSHAFHAGAHPRISRWEAKSSVTAVSRDSFTLQNHSAAPGLSGGAVVASRLGEVRSWLCCGWLCLLGRGREKKGKVVERPLESCCAILARALPRRPSSSSGNPPPSPPEDEPEVPAAANPPACDGGAGAATTGQSAGPS